jgi:ABC-type phosphate/phosphonate transport system permease subunit
VPTVDQIFSERTGLSSGADTMLATDRDERADLAAYRRDRRRARTRRLGTGALGLAVLAGIWQLAAMLLRDPVFLPSVSQTAASFVHYFGRPYPAQGKPLWFDALISLRRILIGFTVGTVIGVALGAAMSASRVARHLVDPVIEVLRPLPPLAFIPLFIIWLGIGEVPKEVLIMIGVIPIMAVTTVAALTRFPTTCGCARGRSARPPATPCCACRSGLRYPASSPGCGSPWRAPGPASSPPS